MKARRLLMLWSLLGCVAATAAESTQNPTTASQPDAPVSATPASTPPPAVEPTPAPPAAPAPKPASADSGKKVDGDFKPSEEISEDMAVAYPVDI